MMTEQAMNVAISESSRFWTVPVSAASRNCPICLSSMYWEQGTPDERMKWVAAKPMVWYRNALAFQPNGRVVYTKYQPYHSRPRNVALDWWSRTWL